MRLGYACMNVALPSKMKTCRLATYEKEGLPKIKELTLSNFTQVLDIVKWNAANDIYFFRVSSDIVPFGSHPILEWEWWMDDEVLEVTSKIKDFASDKNMRLTVHPGQYTVINSPREEVVANAIRDLEYHAKLLDVVGGTDMILHVGGAYGDKEKAKERFCQQYMLLSNSVKDKLRLENDDKVFNVQDVLDISKKIGIPICFDIHHHRCNQSLEKETADYIKEVMTTWATIGKPKMHISSGREHKTDTAHHDFIFLEDFLDFLQLLGDHDVDIMLEAKKKDQALLRLREEWQDK
ncbi:UV DNA damage repair endonuclease UvsE [Bacillus alkalicellulosilyticus]|uniref:UV DNA damage repair endonuclease UvsE n=1 Tax=Alkalihalobacterium alkalicellulosilyticum TaxID=1912214 RepID=UPI00099745D8|nr:UV DNA damage repair endonuclease UvsE [Bacillus alkalicellulosilyticus]